MAAHPLIRAAAGGALVALALLGARGPAAAAPGPGAGEQKVWRALSDAERGPEGEGRARGARGPGAPAGGATAGERRVVWLLLGAAAAVAAAAGIALRRRVAPPAPAPAPDDLSPQEIPEEDVEGLWRVHLRLPRRASAPPRARGTPGP